MTYLKISIASVVRPQATVQCSFQRLSNGKCVRTFIPILIGGGQLVRLTYVVNSMQAKFATLSCYFVTLKYGGGRAALFARYPLE